MDPGGDRLRQWRRRVDSTVLRIQGRFDSDWSDRVLPWLCAAGLFVVLILLASARVRSLDVPVEHAAAVQAIWLIHDGLPPVVTVTTGLHVLASQVAVVYYPLSALAYLLPVRAALVLAQSAALSLAVVPIWRLCRRLANLRVGTSMCVITAYALFPAVHTLNLAGFQPESLALPALLYATFFGLSSRWRRFGVCCVFVILCRADLGLAVAGLGALVWFSGRRIEGRVAVAVGLLYLALAALVIEPGLAGGVYPHAGAHAAFGSAPAEVVGNMIIHPAEVLGALLREENLDLLIGMLAPVVFLPLLAPRFLLPVLPVELLYLTGTEAGRAAPPEQLVPLVAFVFVAAAFALAKLGRASSDRVRVERWVLVVLLVAVVASFIGDAPASPYRHPWAWGGRDLTDQARLEAAKLVGDERPVRASPTIVNELADRQRVYQLPRSHSPDPEAAAADDVEAVVVDLSTVAGWSTTDRAAFHAGLRERGFERRIVGESIEVYLLGEP